MQGLLFITSWRKQETNSVRIIDCQDFM